MKITLVIVCAFTSIACVKSCTYLYAEDYTQTFDSHFSYGWSSYSPYVYSCWIIQAPYDKVVYLDSETFSLENACSFDSVEVYDGDSLSSPLDLTVCGNDGVNSYTSSGRYAYVRFQTDGSIQSTGFRMSYKSVDADYNGNDSSYGDDDTTSLTVGAIIGIAFGCLLGLALLIGIIVCVVMVASTRKRGAVHSTTTAGQTTAYTNQAYYTGQQMYVTPGYPGRVIVPSSNHLSTQSRAQLPATQPQGPTATHPVDANEIPLPEVSSAT